MRSNVARRQQEPKPASSPASRPYRIEEQVGYLLRRAHQRASAIFQVTIGDPNITPTQYSSLVKLHEYNRALAKSSRSSRRMDKATMQGVVRRLKERRLVDSRPHPGDARRTLPQPDHRGSAHGEQAPGQWTGGVARDAEAAQRARTTSASRTAFQDRLSRRPWTHSFDSQGACGIVRTRTIWVSIFVPTVLKRR